MRVDKRPATWMLWGLLLVSPFPALGAGDAPAAVLTLNQALDIALRQNPSVQNAQIEVNKADVNVKAARTREFPSLNLDATGSRNLTPQTYHFKAGIFGPVPPEDVNIQAQNDYSSIVSLSISQPLSQLYRIGLSVDQKKVMSKIAEQQLRSSRQEMARRVKQAYYDLLKTQNLLHASEESITFYTELEHVVQQNYQQKTVLEYQVLEVQSDLARSKHEALEHLSRMQTEKEKLNELLGREISESLSVTEVGLDQQSSPNLDQAKKAAVDQRPETNEAQLKLQHAQYGYRIERSRYWPDIGLRLRYSRLFNTQFIPDELSAIELTARWEFFDWGRKSHELEEKNYAVNQARNQIWEARSRVLTDVNSSVRKLDDARDLVKVTQLTVAATKEKSRVLMNQYRQKTALLDDVLKAQSQWVDAVTEHANAQLSVWTAQAALARAMGEE